MSSSWILINFIAIWTVAAVTPGPNFFLTLQTGIVHGRRAAMIAVAGLASGTFAWGLFGYFGIALLFALAPWLYLTLKLFGGAYLLFLGSRLILHSFRGPGDDTPHRHLVLPDGQVYRRGLLTGASNPKTALFVSSLFASTLPAHAPMWMGIVCIGAMLTISVCWYSLIALASTTPRLRALYRRTRHWIERCAGAVFIGYGGRLITLR
ncbi:LysE family translocator [Salinicola lusitanus]|uniref:LysE family translocator n=1 Tax=Salinicola lusitanus TaxID=1949085 RepID=A0ABZ3CS94_9GAMM|nr:LysE family translocator [Salinicola lusitanus]